MNDVRNGFADMSDKKKDNVIKYIDEEQFNLAKDKIIGKKHNDKGIGTLSEKTVHAVLKNYFEPDEDKHEVALNGYFADIFNENGIIEIQTGNFNKLRDKLMVFLNEYRVNVVYPMPYDKWLTWVNPKTKDLVGRRKSPRKYSMYDSIKELYKIKMFLKNPNLSITLVMMDMEEYKLLDGWSKDKKKGSTRYDRIPVGIRKILTFECMEDYMQMIPEGLEDEKYSDGFTSADFAIEADISRELATSALSLLNYMEQVERIGKKGRSYCYRFVAI